MARDRQEFPTVIPLNEPELTEFRGLSGTCNQWLERSKHLRDKGKDEAGKYCLRRGYFDSDNLADSFYAYCNDIVMPGFEENNQLDPKPHGKMCRFIVDPYKRKMLQASRGSFKSTIGAAGYATWRIGREYTLTGTSRLRILFASENLDIAQRNMTFCQQIMGWAPEYLELAGDHKGKSADKQRWGIKAITSQFREEWALGEPTISPIGVKASRTGFHYDLIIADDLQAETYSYSADAIDTVDRFFKLLFSMLVQDGTGEFLILSTRWHNDDIYTRIEERNASMDLKQLSSRKFKILKMPARDKKTQSLIFPSIYPEMLLQEIAVTQGSRIFTNQYLLEAVADEDVQLKPEYVHYWRPAMLEGRKLNKYLSLDIAFTEMQKGYVSKKHAWTVILLVGIDEDWNYFILDWFRAQCTKLTTVKQTYKMWEQHKPNRVLLQKFDRSQIGEAFRQHGHEVGRQLPLEWIAYPAGHGRTPSKIDRIDNSVVTVFESGRMFLQNNMEWFLKYEYYDYPDSKYFDGLDALCNVTYYSNPAHKKKIVHKKTYEQILIERLKAGLGRQGRHGDSNKSWKNL